MASATAPRRKSAGSGAAMSSGLGMTGTAGGTGGAGAGTASAGAIGRARMDANLRMSSKTAKDDERVPMQHARNKSSERLHRLGGGASSQQLAHTKRSKSYSQIAHATAAAPSQANGATRKVAKLRRGRSEGQAGKSDADGKDADEDDGWTSADQTAEDVEGSAQGSKESDESDEEDGALTFGRRNDKGKERPAATATKGASERPEQAAKVAEKAHSDAPVLRDTIDAASDKTPLARPVALPEQKDDRHIELDGKTSSEMVRQSSEDTLATDPTDNDLQRSVQSSENSVERPEAHQGPEKALPRQKSTASVRTLTDASAKDNHASPLSTSISNSTLNRKRTSFMPRNSSFYAVPPQLSTEYAIAGGRGSEPNSKSRMNRSSDSNLDSNFLANTKTQHRSVDRSLDSTPAYRFSTIDPINSSSSSSSDARRLHRRSSVSSTRSRSSIINLPGVLPSLGVISHDSVNAESTGAQTSRAIEAMQRASNGGSNLGDSSLAGSSQSAFTLPVRQRTLSTQSTTGLSEAARLASKLRMTRDASGDDYTATGSMSSTASRMLANSGSKFFSTIKSDGPTTRALARYNKPTVSIFVKRQDDFKTIEKIVEQGSLFDENFARANLATFSDQEDDDEEDDADQHDQPHQEHHRSKANRPTSKRQPSGRGRNSLHVRYVMDFGLSGPAVERTPTTQALLSTCLDNDEYEATWAPALAQAAGLGGSATAQDASAYSSREDGGRAGNGDGSLPFPAAFGRGGAGMDLVAGAAGGEGVFINGPNATPLHFLHGLTNTNDSPFPLDEADVAPSSTALAAAYHDGHAGHPSNALGHGEYVDAKNLRAVALTWAALNTTKNHIVTRRYVDPMRESVERVMLAAGFGQNHGHSGKSAGAGAAKQDWHETRWPAANASGGSQQQSHAAFAQQSYHGNGGGDAIAGGGHQTPGRGAGTPGGSSRWGWRNLFAEQS